MVASAEKYFTFQYSFTKTKITANIRYIQRYEIIDAADKSAEDIIDCNSIFDV